MNEQHAFEWALEQLRMGKKVARSGWNGKDMYIVLQKGYPDGIPINQNTAEATGIAKGAVCRFLPYLMIKVQCSGTPAFVPWFASQADLLGADWVYA